MSDELQDLKRRQIEANERLKIARQALDAARQMLKPLEEAEQSAWLNALNISTRLNYLRQKGDGSMPMKQWCVLEAIRTGLSTSAIWYRLSRHRRKYYPNLEVHHVNQRVVLVKVLDKPDHNSAKLPS